MGNAFYSNLNKICILIKRALKIINNDSNYSTFYIIHKSLLFHDIVKMNSIKFMFKARNNLLNINLQKLYSIKLHNTYLFHILKIRTDRKSFFLSITCPRLWNNVDDSIRKILNFNLFKRTLKKYLLNSYHYIFNCPSNLYLY